MELVHGLPQSINEQPSILTIGVFDGIHLGHQHLIHAAVSRARQVGFQSVVLTFNPHPDVVLKPTSQRLYLSSLEERIEQIAQLGVDLLIVLPFTPAVMSLGAADFMTQICQAIALRELWVGWDFALGRKREGNLNRLQEIGQQMGYTVHPVDALLVDGSPISSSRIRALLEEGNLAPIPRLLGRPFSLRGPVVEGDKRGRTIGFPTANVSVSDEHIIPGNGVYVCKATVQGQEYGAVTNVGIRPTFNGTVRRIEAYLLDFSGDIYGEELQVQFLHRLRGEQKFNGIAELVAQIGNDAAAARAWLADDARSEA